jgi:hypothetical protein
MTYTWEIIKLGHADITNAGGENLADAIIQVQWRKTATDSDGNSSVYLGKTDLDVSTTSAADFVALDDVTKENVVAWVEESLTTSEVTMINNILQKKVQQTAMTKISPAW